VKVTTAEFIKNFGSLADKALAEPLTITKHGRDRFVLVEAAEYARLERRSRRVVPLTAFTDEDMDLITKAAQESGNAELDKELEGWKP
jgi:prevent-host-death family protein